MTDPYAAVDNSMSFAGLYGLANPTVSWLIARGFGELVALTPEELHRPIALPLCPAPFCGRRMEYRSVETRAGRQPAFVCYVHPNHPVRRPCPPRLQQLPPCPWTPLECVGYEVDVQYSRLPTEAKATWKWARVKM